jgi:hypothetical protein
MQTAGGAWCKSYSYFTHIAKIIVWFNVVFESKARNKEIFYFPVNPSIPLFLISTYTFLFLFLLRIITLAFLPMIHFLSPINFL